MKQLTSILFLPLLLMSNLLVAQTNVGLKTVQISEEGKIDEEKIEALAYSVLNAKSDLQKDSANQALRECLRTQLSKKAAFSYSFDNVKSLSILTSSDSAFRMFNWNIPYSNGSYSFECYFLQKGQKPFLLDNSIDSLHSENWIPALYYSVVTKPTKFQTYYTLLGWKGNNRLTTKKIIEVLWFKSDGKVQFGAPIFQTKGEKKSRIVFEYSAQHSMKLNYNPNLDRIEFDHLSPPRQSLTGIYEYYSPDLSYDAFKWENEKWILKEDLFLNKTDATEDPKKPSKKEPFKEKDFINEKDIDQNKSLFEPKK